MENRKYDFEMNYLRIYSVSGRDSIRSRTSIKYDERSTNEQFYASYHFAMVMFMTKELNNGGRDVYILCYSKVVKSVIS